MAEQYYDTLHAFLLESDTSVLDFADRIRMFSEMFKELLKTRSRMIIGTFTSVIVGMKGIVDEETDSEKKEELKKLYSKFYEEYFAECSESFLSATNPHFRKRIEEMAAFAGQDLYGKVYNLYHPDDPLKKEEPVEEAGNAGGQEAGEKATGEKAVPAGAEGDPLKALAAVLAALNEDGIYEVLKRARELTFVPEYKK